MARRRPRGSALRDIGLSREVWSTAAVAFSGPRRVSPLLPARSPPRFELLAAHDLLFRQRSQAIDVGLCLSFVASACATSARAAAALAGRPGPALPPVPRPGAGLRRLQFRLRLRQSLLQLARIDSTSGWPGFTASFSCTFTDCTYPLTRDRTGIMSLPRRRRRCGKPAVSHQRHPKKRNASRATAPASMRIQFLWGGRSGARHRVRCRRGSATDGRRRRVLLFDLRHGALRSCLVPGKTRGQGARPRISTPGSA